jgi:hypothetical protein
MTQRELKLVADMLDCSVHFVKPGSFNVRTHAAGEAAVEDLGDPSPGHGAAQAVEFAPFE